MPKRTKAARDMEEVQAAASRVLQHVIQTTEGTLLAAAIPDTRNAAAVALGKLGASRGGLARARKLSKARRKQIARKAAKSRWNKKTRSSSGQ